MSRSSLAGCIVAAVLTIGAGVVQAQKITRGPYLQWVTGSSIYVVWDQDKASTPTVHYGKSASYTHKKTSANGTHHEVKLSGLSAGTTYHYAVYSGSTKLSAGATFGTAVAPGKPFRFVVLGDTRSQATKHKEVVTAVTKEPGVRFYLNTGDLVSSGEVASQWSEFFKLEAAALARMPLFSTIGNHDEKSGKATLYRKYFVLPTNSKDPEEYYSFDYGNVHFTVLDGHVNLGPLWICVPKLLLAGEVGSECLSDKQEQWLNSDLKAASSNSKIDHIMVLIHAGPYSSKPGRNGNPLMRALLPTFKKYKVTMIMSGHDHYYEHGVSGNGIPYVITGGGGAPLYSIGTPSPLIKHKVIYNKSIYHYVLVEVDGKYIKVTVRTPQGIKLEQFAMGIPPKPPVDASLPKPDSGVDSSVTPDLAATVDQGSSADHGTKPDQPATTKDGARQPDGGTLADSGPAHSDGAVAAEPQQSGDQGCSCTTGGGATPSLLLGLLLLLVLRAPRSLLTNSLRVAGIADPSPLPALRRKTGNNKYRHLRRALAAGRLGAPARSGICRKAPRRRRSRA